MLSPRLQQAARMLQMSSMDFAALLREKLDENPFLEMQEADHDSADIGGDDPQGPLTALLGNDEAPPQASLDEPLQDAPSPAYDDDDRELWQHGVTTHQPQDGFTTPMSAIDTRMAEVPLNLHLQQQVGLLPLPERDLALARFVVESLDDDGYLRTPLEELADVAALTPQVAVEEMQVALRRVQSLDPQGVGARSVGECLQLQLPQIECATLRHIAGIILADALPALAARDLPRLVKITGHTPAQVQAACDRIRLLQPRPGWQFSAGDTAYVVPDVLVRRSGSGVWTVRLNPAVLPRVRLNQSCADLFQSHLGPAHVALAGHLQEAKWTLRNVGQRFKTILNVAQAIVERQSYFLEFGPMAMKPLMLSEIADAVGVHESTVSRVTNNKYMATPTGVFELKHFFSRSLVSASGSPCSATAIRSLIKDIIGAEAPTRPLSDSEVTSELAMQGLVVARRTVTKYRQILRLDSADRRRRHE